jgi:hypothetical protein
MLSHMLTQVPHRLNLQRSEQLRSASTSQLRTVKLRCCARTWVKLIWLQLAVILLVDASVNNSLSVIISRHMHERCLFMKSY